MQSANTAKYIQDDFEKDTNEYFLHVRFVAALLSGRPPSCCFRARWPRKSSALGAAFTCTYPSHAPSRIGRYISETFTQTPLTFDSLCLLFFNLEEVQY
jgi:hypothetical protein